MLVLAVYIPVLLPNLLVHDLLGAIQASRAVKVYVCNIATQSGETDVYTVHDHVRALEEHIGDRVFDVLLCNDNYKGSLAEDSHGYMPMKKHSQMPRARLENLTDESYPWRHDSAKLAEKLIEILDEYTGPLE